MCIINLGTFIHREPSLAAPLLPEILRVVTKSRILFHLFLIVLQQCHNNIRSQGGSQCDVSLAKRDQYASTWWRNQRGPSIPSMRSSSIGA